MIELFTPREASHSGGFFLFGIRDSGFGSLLYAHGCMYHWSNRTPTNCSTQLKKILPRLRAALNFFCNLLFFFLTFIVLCGINIVILISIKLSILHGVKQKC
jgi:hypothetical protein